MTKRMSLLLAVLLLGPILVACGTTPTATEAPSAAPAAPAAGEATTAPATDAPAADNVDRSKLSKELFVYNWTDYIDESLLADFEKEYGVTVNYETYDSNEDMLAKIRAGNSGYDVVVPSDYAVDIMGKEGLAAELDKANIPNITHLNPEFLKQEFDPENKYSLPYFVGTTGIAYNQKFFPTPPDSWSYLFDPAKLEAVKGKVSMLDDERESIGAALIYTGKTLNESDPAAIAKAQELLVAQKPFLASYNSSDFNRKLASEEVIIAHAWNGGSAQAYAGIGEDLPGNPDVRFIIPKEGGTLWMDNMVIVADSPNKYTAEVFFNFMLRPENSARNADYTLYVTPNKDAEGLISKELQAVYAAGFKPSADEVKRLQSIKRSDSSSVIFSDVWTKVKSS